MKYCPYCGKFIDGQPCTCEGALEEQAIAKAAHEEQLQKQAQKKNTAKKAVKIVVPLILIAVLAIGGFAVYSYFTNGIDLSQYIEVYNVTGFNGEGVIRFGFEDDGLYETYYGNEYEDMDANNMTEAQFMEIMTNEMAKSKELEKLIDCVELTASKTEGLSNGDVITITATFNKPSDYKFKKYIKSGEITYTVEGLVDGKTFDPFDKSAINVVFEGNNGNGYGKVELLINEVPYTCVRYDVSPMAALSNGDTATVFVNYNVEELERNEYFVPEVLKKEFAVTGLAEYCTEDDLISNNAPLRELRDTILKESLSVIEQSMEDGYSLKGEPVASKVFFIKGKEPNAVHNDWDKYQMGSIYNAAIYFVDYIASKDIQEVGEQGEEITTTIEKEYRVVWMMPNFIIDSDESISFEEDSCHYDVYEGAMLDTIKALESEFSEMEFHELFID